MDKKDQRETKQSDSNMGICQYIRKVWGELWNPDSRAWQITDRILFVLLPTIASLLVIIPKTSQRWRDIMTSLLWVIPLSIWLLFILVVVPYRLVKKYHRQYCDALKKAKQEPSENIIVTVRELRNFRVVADGMGVDAATILKALWDKFTVGVSQSEAPGYISNQFAGGSNSATVLKAVNSITNHLCLYKIIESEERTMYSSQGTWKETYWKLTDSGKEVVQYLLE